MSRFLLSAFVIVGALALSSGSASAQYCHGGGYGGGYSSGGYYGGSSFGVQVYSTPSYNYAPQYVSSGYQNYQPSYGGYAPSYQSYQSYAPRYGYSGHSYHNTSHYDYHAPSVQVHRNHLDYVPGHYDYHRTGHRH